MPEQWHVRQVPVALPGGVGLHTEHSWRGSDGSTLHGSKTRWCGQDGRPARALLRAVCWWTITLVLPAKPVRRHAAQRHSARSCSRPLDTCAAHKGSLQYCVAQVSYSLGPFHMTTDGSLGWALTESSGVFGC